MSFQIEIKSCLVKAPNCAGGDPIQVIFKVTDQASSTGTISLNGTLNAINEIDDINYLLVDGVDNVFNINTTMGMVVVNATYDAGYDVNTNILVEMDVVDCMSWQNIESDCGNTNAIVDHTGDYLMDHTGAFLAFIL